ncbi:MAG: type II toxin-antitoxin system RelE/ParE family toxin [Ruminococcus sp.]|nr:type II toxin-antitoxin system RelE/ParE family toxin [Ruminococcus sp.]
MRTYEIRFEKAAQKFLDKQDKSQRLRLYKAIYKLPDGTDIKKLSGHNLYRLRVGDYRILYMIDNEIRLINIENIDNRGDVYKRY